MDGGENRNGKKVNVEVWKHIGIDQLYHEGQLYVCAFVWTLFVQTVAWGMWARCMIVCANVHFCVCGCKLDIRTWKMKVNSLVTQGYFCPSIHLSVFLTLPQFKVPVTSCSCPTFLLPLSFHVSLRSLSRPICVIYSICGHISRSNQFTAPPSHTHHPASRRPVTLPC